MEPSREFGEENICYSSTCVTNQPREDMLSLPCSDWANRKQSFPRWIQDRVRVIARVGDVMKTALIPNESSWINEQWVLALSDASFKGTLSCIDTYTNHSHQGLSQVDLTWPSSTLLKWIVCGIPYTIMSLEWYVTLTQELLWTELTGLVCKYMQRGKGFGYYDYWLKGKSATNATIMI